MATTEDLERRLKALENEVTALRHVVFGSFDDPPEVRGARSLLLGRLTQPQFAAGWEKALKEMGIAGEAVQAEQLQQRMIESGKDPKDNSFSRDLIAMREE